MSNQYPSKPVVTGKVKISENVIRSIAQEAALEIDGVESLAAPRKSVVRSGSSVTIDIKDDAVAITLNLILKSGYRLQQVAEQVQRMVKENVQNMTGVVVSKVNIVAAGLVF